MRYLVDFICRNILSIFTFISSHIHYIICSSKSSHSESNFVGTNDGHDRLSHGSNKFKIAKAFIAHLEVVSMAEE